MAPRTQHSHCSYCGSPYPAESPWPRLCAGCGETTWRNPLPVAVLLVPVELAGGAHGLVVVRRDIDPGRGHLCLPSGYIEHGESWQEAAVRELSEEAGLTADPADIRLFDVHSVPNGAVLIFGLLPPRPEAELPAFTPNEESTERSLLTGPAHLAFPSQSRVVVNYFATYQSSG